MKGNESNSHGLPSLSPKWHFEEREHRYHLLIESIKDYAIFMLNPQGYISSWNSGAEKLKGYTKEEILHQHFSIFYTEKDLQRNHPANELKIARKKGKYEEEGWRKKKDGSLFWANVVISAIYNEKKQIIGFSKVTRDLTERKMLEDKLIHAKEELRESEERARLLIASVKDYAIFLLTPDGKIASWNEGAKRIKGYEAEEIIGSHFSRFYPQEAVAANFPEFELAKALEAGRFEDEGWRVKKDGSLFWANVIITPIYNEQKQHIGFTKITRDLSERVRNEELMKKNMELHKINTDLDNFIYIASHDLKAPITNLEGLLILMDDKISPKLDDSEKRIVHMMSNSVMRLNHTISSLLEIAKAQKNLEEVVETISFQEVLEDVKEELSPQITDTQANIEEDFTVKTLVFVKASLRSIIYNLLSNAIKYRSPERLPVIRIRTYKEEDQIVLQVQDNGLGLSKEQEAKLFTMFKRFHRHVEGTGIGLYIVKRNIENYGGKIQVKSKLNEGTEFKLYFKL